MVIKYPDRDSADDQTKYWCNEWQWNYWFRSNNIVRFITQKLSYLKSCNTSPTNSRSAACYRPPFVWYRGVKSENALGDLRTISAKKSSGGNFYNTLSSRTGKRFLKALIASTLEGKTQFTDAFRMLGIKKPLYSMSRPGVWDCTMKYLLDNNVFIAANNLHYGLDFCQAFWERLIISNSQRNLFSIAWMSAREFRIGY